MSSQSRFVLCIANEGYPASLELRKVYRSLADPAAENDGLLRVVDESGQDYLYPSEYFVPIEVPEKAEDVIAGVA